MRNLAIRLLALFRRVCLLLLKLRGKTPAEAAAERVVSGKAWDEYCDTLKAAGAALSFPGTPQDPFNQAEGYRYLSRLTRGGLMAFVEYADPRAPVLHLVAHETVKLGSDNPVANGMATPVAAFVTQGWRPVRSAIWHRTSSPFTPSHTTRRRRMSFSSTCRS